MGDACLGLTRLRAAAKSSHGLTSTFTDGYFVPDDQVKDLLAERTQYDRSLLDPPSCVEFKAAKPLGKLSAVMDTTGMAALICRHEFVAAAVNMFTPENFVYYDIMLASVLKQFDGSEDRHLRSFFLDIACQFKPYWAR